MTQVEESLPEWLHMIGSHHILISAVKLDTIMMKLKKVLQWINLYYAPILKVRKEWIQRNWTFQETLLMLKVGLFPSQIDATGETKWKQAKWRSITKDNKVTIEEAKIHIENAITTLVDIAQLFMQVGR